MFSERILSYKLQAKDGYSYMNKNFTKMSDNPPSTKPKPALPLPQTQTSEDLKVAKDNFASLMRSRMIEAKFLIDRAKKIDDRVDVEGEMGKLRTKN